MTSLATTEAREYKEVRKEIYNGLDNSKDKWMQEYICIVFDIIEDKFKSYKAEHYNDMINAGVVGLLTAKAKFDETRGTKFSTYAYISIYNAILAYVRDINNVHAGRNKWQRCYKKVKELVKKGTPYEIAWIELRNSEKLDRNDFYVLWLQATGADISYEGIKEKAGECFDIIDKEIDVEGEVLSNDTIERIYKGIEEQVTEGMKRDMCKEYVGSILNGDKWKCMEVAERYGVSRQYVGQVIDELKRYMREWIEC